MCSRVNSVRLRQLVSYKEPFGRKALSWKQSPEVQYSHDKRYHLESLKILILPRCPLVLVKLHAGRPPNIRITLATPFLRTSSMLYQTGRIGKRYTLTSCFHFLLVESRSPGSSTAVRRVFGLLPIPEVRSQAKRALPPGERCREKPPVRKRIIFRTCRFRSLFALWLISAPHGLVCDKQVLSGGAPVA